MSTKRNFDESKRVRDKKGQFASTGRTAEKTPAKQRKAPALPVNVQKKKPAQAKTANTLHAAHRTVLTKTRTEQRKNAIRMKKVAVQRIYAQVSNLVYGDPNDPHTIAQREKLDNTLKLVGFPHGIDWNTNSN